MAEHPDTHGTLLRMLFVLAVAAALTGCLECGVRRGEINVIEHGADPTGAVDCTELLTRLHNTGRRIYYPNGTYRFNGRHLDLSGGVRFESSDGVTVRNDISTGNILQFDDAGNLIGLQQNHLEEDEKDLGGRKVADSGNLVRPPLSRVHPVRKADFLGFWYNDFGLECKRVHDWGWLGWYYWSWNHHDAGGDGYDPARHPLPGFYRGDDPVVLDWQCYWLNEYGVAGVILYTASSLPKSRTGLTDTWADPGDRNYWIQQLFTNVPNFRNLRYVMTGCSPWTKDCPEEDRMWVEKQWHDLIDKVYLTYTNAYTMEIDGKTYPVVYVHEEGAMRGVFDNYRGADGTVAFYLRMARYLQEHGYGGLAIFARHAISESMVDWDALRSSGIQHFTAFYSKSHGTGPTYADRVATYSPPTSPDTILNVVTSCDTHTPHPSKWVCPGHSPQLFRQLLEKALQHVETHDLPRVITCYNIAEWTEGGPGLQPNMQDRFGYLEAVRDVLVTP